MYAYVCQCELLVRQVTKRHVDNYMPGRRIPNCQLSAEFVGLLAELVPLSYYEVSLIGAKPPHNKFTIRSPSSGMYYN